MKDLVALQQEDAIEMNYIITFSNGDLSDDSCFMTESLFSLCTVNFWQLRVL